MIVRMLIVQELMVVWKSFKKLDASIVLSSEDYAGGGSGVTSQIVRLVTSRGTGGSGFSGLASRNSFSSAAAPSGSDFPALRYLLFDIVGRYNNLYNEGIKSVCFEYW